MQMHHAGRWRRRLFVPLLAGLFVCACAGNTTHVSGNGSGSAVGPTATPLHAGYGPAGAPPPYDTINFSTQKEIWERCGDPAAGPYPLRSFLQRTYTTTASHDRNQANRVAAVVTYEGLGAARWNMPNGQQPSQPYLDTLNAAAQAWEVHQTPGPTPWPVAPSIYTAVKLHVDRLLRGSLPGDTVTGFYQGGTVGTFTLHGCSPLEVPQVGQTYLVFLDGELTTGAMNVPVAQPLIGTMLSYDQQTHFVQTYTGPQNLDSALEGLPPG